MALRGDPPIGESGFKPHLQGFKYASELVDFINKHSTDFEIGVGGYPEKHPEAPSIERDIENLKHKVEAGADFITTQLFYNNNHYNEFFTRCRNKKIDCPIIPGLMIPTNLKRVERFCNFCNAELPETLKSLMKSAGNDKEALKKRLDRETPLLIKEGWNDKEINLLKTHFTFYLGLVNGDIKPLNENHKKFIQNIKNRKNIKLDDIHQKIYSRYIDFFTNQNLKKKDETKDEVWNNIETNPIGMREYPQSVLEKFDIEYEEIGYNEWYDDWKHS